MQARDDSSVLFGVSRFRFKLSRAREVEGLLCEKDMRHGPRELWMVTHYLKTTVDGPRMRRTSQVAAGDTRLAAACARLSTRRRW